MDKRQTAIMMAQFKKAVQEPSEFIKFCFKSESEPNIWYILLSGFAGNEGEFTYEEVQPDGSKKTKYGEYLCRMEAPHDFPFNPPQFYMLTENGLYGVEKKVCISIGEYHKDQYRAALGMAGFANQLVSGLIGWRDMGGGIEIHRTDVATKKRFAAASRAKNHQNFPEIMRKIDESYAGYSSKWDLSKVPQYLKDRLGLLSPAPTQDVSVEIASQSPNSVTTQQQK